MGNDSMIELDKELAARQPVQRTISESALDDDQLDRDSFNSNNGDKYFSKSFENVTEPTFNQSYSSRLNVPCASFNTRRYGSMEALPTVAEDAHR